MSLEIRGLSKSFDGKAILEGFSYKFDNTGIYAIMGNSGVGKTTLLRLIAGLDKKYEGEIIGGGSNNTSFVFQEYRLFPTLSALENVVLANNESMSEEAIQQARGLLLTLGFKDEELSLRPEALSGGMKQRVSLARAIMRKKPILLLDEPTKELNEELAAQVLEMLVELSKSRLVIFVTHKESDVTQSAAVKITLANESTAKGLT